MAKMSSTLICLLLFIRMVTFYHNMSDIPQFIVTTNSAHVWINSNMAYTYTPAHSLTHTAYSDSKSDASSSSFHSNLQPIMLVWDKREALCQETWWQNFMQHFFDTSYYINLSRFAKCHKQNSHKFTQPFWFTHSYAPYVHYNLTIIQNSWSYPDLGRVLT